LLSNNISLFFKELQAYWESSEFVDVSNKAKKNRAYEKSGCIYAGGSISVAEHGRRLVKMFTTLFNLF
jgi:hypothetical protein